jgi:hypothetical protein
MTYDGESDQMDGSTSLPCGGRVPLWSWQQVEERMVEAMGHWRRSHDSEARFSLGGRISSIWRMAFTDKMALIEMADLEKEKLKPLPLSRGDMARMAEASEWLRFVAEDDRRLVVLALGKLASGHSRVPWLKLKRQLGVRFGAEGLRKRYSRSITRIANALNSPEMAESCEGGVSSPQTPPPSK